MKAIFLLAGSIFLSVLAGAATDSTECLECHSEKIEKAFLHGAVGAECLFCHGDHEAETGFPYNLLDEINKVCFVCHNDFPDSAYPPEEITPGGQRDGHPVYGHPTLGLKDPVYPEKAFTCASCHNPHGAPSRKLFRYKYSKIGTPYGGNLCYVCHYGIGNPGPTPKPPPWE